LHLVSAWATEQHLSLGFGAGRHFGKVE
jgi:hypothetical protein